MSTDYVTSSEGMLLLGVDRSTFFYYVDRQEIAMEAGKTRRHNRYLKQDILAVKEARKKKRLARVDRMRDASFTLDWMYPRDLTAALDLDYIVYDHRIIASFDTYETWLSKNPHIAMCAYDKKDRRKMLAYVAMLPLPETTIMEVVTGQRDEMDIQASEILTYDQSGEYTLLANSAVTHPDRPDLLYQVLTHLMQFWIEQYPTRRISRIYAQAASAAGDVLISKLYFAPLYYIVNNQAQIVKDAYVLDMARPGASKVIRHFQKSLDAKREELDLTEIALSTLPPLQIAQPQATETPVIDTPIIATPQREKASRTRAERASTPRSDFNHIVVEAQPENTVSLQALVQDLGINRSTLLTRLKTNGIQHYAVQKPNRPQEYERFFTPEQVAWIKTYSKAQPSLFDE